MSEVPGSACSTQEKPECVQEVEENWQDSIESVWDKVRSTRTPTDAEWLDLIKAERLNRMAWMASEDTKVKKKKSGMASLLGSRIGATGELEVVEEIKPKKRRATTKKAAK